MELIKLIWPLIAIELILKVIALRDLGRRESDEVKGGNRLVWAVVILIISALGPVTYLVWGREEQ